MNTHFLLSNLIAGAIVILTYIYYLPKLSLDEAWGNIKGNERNFTIIYMIVAAISFSYILYHFTITKINKSTLLYTSLIIFFIGVKLFSFNKCFIICIIIHNIFNIIKLYNRKKNCIVLY